MAEIHISFRKVRFQRTTSLLRSHILLNIRFQVQCIEEFHKLYQSSSLFFLKAQNQWTSSILEHLSKDFQAWDPCKQSFRSGVTPNLTQFTLRKRLLVQFLAFLLVKVSSQRILQGWILEWNRLAEGLGHNCKFWQNIANPIWKWFTFPQLRDDPDFKGLSHF